jgi:hypothetical protein
MEKMRKKGYFEVDIIAGVVIAIFLLLFAASLNFVQTQTFEIDAFKSKINNDLFLINLLKTDGADTTISDIIVKDYFDNDFSLTKTEINKLMMDTFANKVCWTLVINDKTASENTDCKKMSELDIGDIDAVAIIPVIKNYKIETITVRLQG